MGHSRKSSDDQNLSDVPSDLFEGDISTSANADVPSDLFKEDISTGANADVPPDLFEEDISTRELELEGEKHHIDFSKALDDETKKFLVALLQHQANQTNQTSKEAQFPLIKLPNKNLYGISIVYPISYEGKKYLISLSHAILEYEGDNKKGGKRYKILEDQKLGCGSEGEVIASDHVIHFDEEPNVSPEIKIVEKKSAIKMVVGENGKPLSEEQKDSLQQEATMGNIFHQLKMKNKPFYIDGVGYLVMENGGENFNTFIKSNGKRSLSECINLMIATLKVLNQLYLKNMVHRDLKPHNMLWNKKELILIDFSHAKIGIETDKEIFGTMDYIAPEAVKRFTIPSSDIYSAGGILLKLLYFSFAKRSEKEFGSDDWIKDVIENGYFEEGKAKKTIESKINNFKKWDEDFKSLNLDKANFIAGVIADLIIYMTEMDFSERMQPSKIEEAIKLLNDVLEYFISNKETNNDKLKNTSQVSTSSESKSHSFFGNSKLARNRQKKLIEVSPLLEKINQELVSFLSKESNQSEPLALIHERLATQQFIELVTNGLKNRELERKIKQPAQEEFLKTLRDFKKDTDDEKGRLDKILCFQNLTSLLALLVEFVCSKEEKLYEQIKQYLAPEKINHLIQTATTKEVNQFLQFSKSSNNKDVLNGILEKELNEDSKALFADQFRYQFVQKKEEVHVSENKVTKSTEQESTTSFSKKLDYDPIPFPCFEKKGRVTEQNNFFGKNSKPINKIDSLMNRQLEEFVMTAREAAKVTVKNK